MDVSTFPPGSMLRMDFVLLNTESIRGFTSVLVAISSTTWYSFLFPPRSKLPPLYILKFPINILRNQDKKFALIQVGKDGALARSSEFTRICHNTKTIVRTTGGDTSYLNEESEILNKKMSNMTREILLN